MKIINIIGGIGNQMFQYAMALALKSKYPGEEVKIDITHFNGYGLHNGFEIDRVFGNQLPCATKRDLFKLSFYAPNYKLSRIIRKLFGYRKTEYKEPRLFTYWGEAISAIQGDCYFEGSWQNSRYFEGCANTVRNAFRFKLEISDKNKKLLQQLESTNSVGIHVRRGDYLLENAYKNICDIAYYKNAINYINSKLADVKFYIFSNDAKWCGDYIVPICGDAQVIDWNIGNDSWIDMMMLSRCKHNIIAHSSFSWWAAWLNQNPKKIVVAPTGWFNQKGITDKPQLPSWILIDNK